MSRLSKLVIIGGREGGFGGGGGGEKKVRFGLSLLPMIISLCRFSCLFTSLSCLYFSVEISIE